MIENEASRRYRGVSHLLVSALPFLPSWRAFAPPQTLFIPLSSQHTRYSATNVNPRLFSDSRHWFNKLRYSLLIFVAHCALGVAYTFSRFQNIDLHEPTRYRATLASDSVPNNSLDMPPR